jgi:hypothetical protein
MQETIILGILVYDRIKEAGRTQAILSKYAEVIRTRLGFHELSETICSRVGTIVLIMQGDPDMRSQLEEELSDIGGIEVQKMTFDHLYK